MSRRSRQGRKQRNALARQSGALASQSDNGEIEGLVSEHSFETELTTGPIPGPNMLAKYNELVPGSGDALVKEMQLNGAHRRRAQTWIAFANAFAFVVSNAGAWIIDAGIVAGSLYLIHEDKPVQGFALIVTELVALRWGRRPKKK